MAEVGAALVGQDPLRPAAILEKVAQKWNELDLEMTGGVRGEALPTLMAVRYQLASAFQSPVASSL